MTARDVYALRQRIDLLVITATKLRDHAADLYDLGWSPAVTDVENVASGKPESKPPSAGDPRARRLFERIVNEVGSINSELVGLDRAMGRLFFAGSEAADDGRGRYPLLISRADHDDQLARQRARADGHPLLVEQPAHPGAKK